MSKIVHICLCGPFSDNFSYQENILTKYHKKLGYDVYVLTSKNSWDSNGKIKKVEKNRYLNNDGVNIIRMDSCNKGKFVKYRMVNDYLVEISPDIIFVHGCNFSDIDVIRKYTKKYQCTLYIDNHADETNSAKNFLSKYILHKIIWRRKVRKIIPYVRKFYGVLPKRCDFLEKMYGVSKEKIDLLIMGFDDELLSQPFINLSTDNKKIISIGGKIDEYKAAEILNFLEAFTQVNLCNYKIIIYGSIIDNYKNQILRYCQNENIEYAGWLEHPKIVNIIKNSSYCVFPGRHSVLWEEAVCIGKPIIVKYIDGYQHIDIGGNVVYLIDSSIEYYMEVLNRITDETFLNDISNNALSNNKNEFLYSKIAKKSLEIE